MSVPIHVLHVPGADPQRDAIVRRLKLEGQACVHNDRLRMGCMDTWLRALGHAASENVLAGDEWVAIVSDDADPLHGWQTELMAACQNSPEPVLGLTHFGEYGRKGVAKGVPYLVGPHLVWGGAIAYHRSVLRPLYSWAQAVVASQDYPHDDILVMEFQRLTGRKTALTSRAIFGQPAIKSLMGHGGSAPRSPATTIAAAGVPWDARPAFVTCPRPVPGRLPDLTNVPPPPQGAIR